MHGENLCSSPGGHHLTVPQFVVRMERSGQSGGKRRETSVPLTFLEYLLGVRYCEASRLIIITSREDGSSIVLTYR